MFCQRLKDRNGNPKDFYCTPGGGLEPGETLVDGVIRELIEKTGVTPRVGKLLFIQQYSEHSLNNDHSNSEFLEFFYHIENPDDYQRIDETASHFDAEIYDYGFVDAASTTILPSFLSTVDIESYIQSDKPVYLYTEFGK